MHLHSHARSNPAKPALINASDGSALSFTSLDEEANRSAHLLRQLGLARGDVVATLFGNSVEVFVVNWACQNVGLYTTAISSKLSVDDIAHILRDSGARLLIVSDGFVELALDAIRLAATGLPVYSWSLDDPRAPGWSRVAAACPDRPVEDETPGGDLLYSSGTTGRSKGVMAPLPTGTIEDDTSTSAMARGLYAMDEETVYLSTSPLYHAAPLRWALAVQKLGGTVILMERFDAEEALRLIEAHQVTHSTFVPTHFVRMLRLPEGTRKRYNLRSLRAVIHSAAPCSMSTKRAMIDWLGPIIYEYYSGTECCGVTAITTQEWLARPGSVGRAVLGKIHILGDDGAELATGETGNVYFSDGPEFEYLNDPEKTAEAHNNRGWATMGDIGHVDEKGYLFLSDRKAFMIISGGVNIYPLEIENALVGYPGIADVAVLGLPDEEMGETVVAFVQPTHWPLENEDALRTQLAKFTRERLGSVKAPKIFNFLRELPREPTGKMIKRRLLEQVRTDTVGAYGRAS